MPKNTDQQILEVLTGTAPDLDHKRIVEALDGREYLWGLEQPEGEDAVRVWAAKESLKTAAERFAQSTVKPMTDSEMETIVSETYDRTNEAWSDLTRMERTAEILDRLAARFEGTAK